tara:strand:- start:366 stop:530 length:165 start_codon:yes stop_codon:yes gene_type:complete
MTQRDEGQQKSYFVDFGSITIDYETKNKLLKDKKFAEKWIKDNAHIDKIIREDE